MNAVEEQNLFGYNNPFALEPHGNSSQYTVQTKSKLLNSMLKLAADNKSQSGSNRNAANYLGEQANFYGNLSDNIHIRGINNAIEEDRQSREIFSNIINYVNPVARGVAGVAGGGLATAFVPITGGGSLLAIPAMAATTSELANQSLRYLDNKFGTGSNPYESPLKEMYKTTKGVATDMAMDAAGLGIGAGISKAAPYVVDTFRTVTPTIRNTSKKLMEFTANNIGRERFTELWRTSKIFRSKMANPENIADIDMRRLMQQVGGQKTLANYDAEVIKNATRLPDSWVKPEKFGEFVDDASADLAMRRRAETAGIKVAEQAAKEGKKVFQKTAIAGVVPDAVIKFTQGTDNAIINEIIALTTTRFGHLLRSLKILRGQALSLDDVKDLPLKISDENTRWFYDTEKRNIMFAYVTYGEQYIKVPIDLNQKIQKQIVNAIATAGKTDVSEFSKANLIEIDLQLGK